MPPPITTELTRCRCDMHGNHYAGGHYGQHGEWAVQYVRITCPGCESFRVQAWCKGCLEGIYNSGRRWRCDKCSTRIEPDEKPQFITRLGDL